MPAQSTVPELLARIRQGESVRTSLRELWRRDSSRSHEVAAEAQAAFENLGEGFGKAQTDTLLRIHAIGMAHDPVNPDQWLVQRALLGIGHAQWYPLQHRDWAMAAIRATPMTVPRLLVAHAGEALATGTRNRQIPNLVAAQDWAELDRALLLHQLIGGPEAADWTQLRIALSLGMRSALPDCGVLMAQFAGEIGAGAPSAAACKAFLVIHDLQGCEPSSLLEVARAAALAASSDAWVHRLAGGEAYNRGAWAEAIGHWEQARATEPLPLLQAHDQLQIAAAHQAQAAYRQARTAIQQAMQLAPEWGEPYVALMDLYTAGSAACAFSEFDRKALNWLLMGLCTALRSIDGNYAQEADERHYRYQQQSPTKEEASFWGWNPGDTYPFKCWMSTTATVP